MKNNVNSLLYNLCKLIVIYILSVLFLAAVVSCGATRDFHHNERTVPVEIMEWSSSDSIRSNVNINVNYKYGRDSLRHYLQKQYVNRFFRETEIEYGIRRIFILVRFSGNDPEKVFLFIPDQSSGIDTRIGEIIGSSIDSLKNEWIFPEHSDNTNANAALSLINVP